jgi:hypothetical protein
MGIGFGLREGNQRQEKTDAALVFNIWFQQFWPSCKPVDRGSVFVMIKDGDFSLR